MALPLRAHHHWAATVAAPSPFPPPPTTTATSCGNYGFITFTKRRIPLRGVRAMAVAEEKAGTAVLWFKQDLRTDDHPGLVTAASRHRNIVPLYVFDPRILSSYPDEILELLISALEGLRKSLKDQGSDLVIGFGNVEDVVPRLVNEVKATHIFIEEEVEYNLCRMISMVNESLSEVPFSWGSPELVYWRTPFYDIENLMKLPQSYNEFQKQRSHVTAPLESPTLPVLDIELNRGALPTYDELKKYLRDNSRELDEIWISFKATSAKDIIRKKRTNQAKMSKNLTVGLDYYSGLSNQYSSSSNGSLKRKLESSVFLSRNGNVVGGGTEVALNALAAYLRYLEGTGRDDWQELHEKLRISESRTGASFGVLFRYALYLGVLSRRRVHYETIKYEKERNAGFISPFGYSVTTVAAAVDSVRSMEWYWLLSLKSQISNGGRYPVRIWSWNGHLIQYTVVGHEGPAVLLIHGFGAFFDHYRDNISPIADDGHRVWAITLLGFGKSEKPNVVYTELMWTELLRDFIIDVVGEPVHIVGNSIGGFFAAAVAGLWPAIAKSVVLINTAGSVIPDYSSVQVTEGGKTSGIAWIGARLLLAYLQLRIRSIVKDCYPSNSERADDWLIKEMLRASYDPGVLVVLESVFNFELAIPLNFMLDSFGGQVLIIQGMKDPLSKSQVRLSMFKEHCSGITIRELDAGHCPHDEKPELVNSIIRQWIVNVESILHPVNSI